ncbi:MAG: hypothetical protein R8K21_00465 [Mariprofundales bacterium]
MWLVDDQQQTLRRAFTVWIHRVLLRGKYPQASMQETNNLQEVENRLRILCLKFGTAINSSIIQKVEQAEANELEIWSERILLADSLGDVFIEE